MTLFSLIITDWRRNAFDFILKLRDFQGWEKSRIIDAGLDMIMTNSQIPADNEEKILLFSNIDDINKFCDEHKSDKLFKEKLEEWVRNFNAVSTM